MHDGEARLGHHTLELLQAHLGVRRVRNRVRDRVRLRVRVRDRDRDRVRGRLMVRGRVSYIQPYREGVVELHVAPHAHQAHVRQRAHQHGLRRL